jgi:tetratricopeptide (TPR) repeat protein
VPLAPVKIAVPVPRFVPESVLGASVLAPFLDGLATLHPPSPAVEAVMEQMRNGTFAVPDTPGATPEDEVVLTFLRGLGAYQKGDTAQAAAWFQQTLKNDSEFLGAAFYLGACHAVNGRDKEAVGAWQMALLSDNPAAVYPALVDALLRMGDGRQAVEFLLEAPSAWADDAQRLRREATAEAMLGDYAGALPKLVDLIGPQKADQNLLFMALQVLYRMRLEGNGLSPANKALFADYVTAHQAMGGPNKAIVETWRRFVLKP